MFVSQGHRDFARMQILPPSGAWAQIGPANEGERREELARILEALARRTRIADGWRPS